MRSSAAIGLAVIVLANSTSAWASSKLERQLKAICATETDTAGERDRLVVSVQDTGEAGRVALLKMANSRVPERTCAMRYLVRLNDQRLVPVLRRILADVHSDEEVIQIALQGVASFHDITMLDRTMTLFASGTSGVRFAAANTLAALGDPRGLQALRKAATDVSFGTARIAIARALGVPGDEEAIEPLVALSYDPSFMALATARTELVLSLSRIGSARSRKEAVDLLAGMKEADLRRWLKARVLDIFKSQQRAARDPTEIESIDKLVTVVNEL